MINPCARCNLYFLLRMWRAGLNVKTVTSAADDDDWETDPDFVVRYTSYYNAQCMILYM